MSEPVAGPSRADEDALRAAAPAADFAARRAKAGVAAALFGAEPEPPQTVGRYVLESQLGAGGMGVVYRAHDPELDRAIALKVLHPEGSQDATAQARMVREARALAKLSHPNVIHVYDVGTADEQVFVAMELVDGEDLKRHLEQRQLGWRSVLALFVEAGRGLAAAHAAGLVHRDFKPENVLVARDGRVRVLDFGLARPAAPVPASPADEGTVLGDEELVAILSGATGRDLELTRTGALVGTPLYMAPEQYRGAPADAASDQFAFCVALYEALYGHRPFAGATIAGYARNVVGAEVLAPGGPPGEIPGELFAALARGLAKRPGERYPGMSALLDELAGWLREPALVAATTATGPSGRGRWMLAFSLLALASATVWWTREHDGGDEGVGGRGRAVTSRAGAVAVEGDEARHGGSRPPGASGPGAASAAAASFEGPTDGVRETGEGDDAATEASAPARSGICHLHEDDYRLLHRGSARRSALALAGDCFRCRPETRRSRTKRFSPSDCAGYAVCSPAPAEECR